MKYEKLIIITGNLKLHFLIQEVSQGIVNKYSCGIPFIPSRYFKSTSICSNRSVGRKKVFAICSIVEMVSLAKMSLI